MNMNMNIMMVMVMVMVMVMMIITNIYAKLILLAEVDKGEKHVTADMFECYPFIRRKKVFCFDVGPTLDTSAVVHSCQLLLIKYQKQFPDLLIISHSCCVYQYHSCCVYQYPVCYRFIVLLY